jgi:hypothetical protein
MLWAQMAGEGELRVGTDIPTVIVVVLLEAVRLRSRWDDNYRILHTETQCMRIMYRYILVCTLTSKVYTGIHQHKQGI